MEEPLLPKSIPQKVPPPLSTLLENEEVSPREQSSSPLPEAPSTSPRPSSPSSDIQQWLVDPNYGFRKSNLHRSRTAPAMIAINDVGSSGDGSKKKVLDKPEPSPQATLWKALFLFGMYLSFGVAVYLLNMDHFSVKKTHPFVDAIYFCIVTICTIGYGDITPNSTLTKLFFIVFVLGDIGYVDMMLSGMVTNVLDMQENYLLRTVKAGKQDKSVIIDVKKGRMSILMKVVSGLGVVVLCIGIGMVVMHFAEDLGWDDALYMSVMSVTTVGYGDKVFSSMNGRIFASFWLLVSTQAVAKAFIYLAETRADKRHRKLAEWVIGQDMTVSQFLAADMDNNGFMRKIVKDSSPNFLTQSNLNLFDEGFHKLTLLLISSLVGSHVLLRDLIYLLRQRVLETSAHGFNGKSEYVLYKLKEMRKVSDEDILPICKKFDQLDTGNCGKITLANLMNAHHSAT